MNKIDYRGIQPINSNYRLYTPQSTLDQAYNIRNNTSKYTDTDYGFIDWAIDATHDFYRAVQKGEMDADADRILKANNDIQAAKDIIDLFQFDDDDSNQERQEIIEHLRKNGVWNKNSDPTEDDLQKIIEEQEEVKKLAQENYNHNLEQYGKDIKEHDISQHYTDRSNDEVDFFGNFFYKLPSTMGTSNASPVYAMEGMAGMWAGAKTGAAIGSTLGGVGAAAGGVLGGLLGGLYGNIQSREEESHMEAYNGYRERVMEELSKNKNIDYNKILSNTKQQLEQNGIDTSVMDDNMVLDQLLLNPELNSGDVAFNEIAKNAYNGTRRLYEANNALGFGEMASDLLYFIPIGKYMKQVGKTTAKFLGKATGIERAFAKRAAAGADIAKHSLNLLEKRIVGSAAKRAAWDRFKATGVNMLVEGSEEGTQNMLTNEYIRGDYDEDYANDSFFDAVADGSIATDLGYNTWLRARSTVAAFTDLDPEYSGDDQLFEEYISGMLLPLTSPQGIIGTIGNFQETRKNLLDSKRFAAYYANALAEHDALDRKVQLIKNLNEAESARSYADALGLIRDELKSGKYDLSGISLTPQEYDESFTGPTDNTAPTNEEIDKFFDGQISAYNRIKKLIGVTKKRTEQWELDENQSAIYNALLDNEFERNKTLKRQTIYNSIKDTANITNLANNDDFIEKAFKEIEFGDDVTDEQKKDMKLKAAVATIAYINKQIKELDSMSNATALQSDIQSQLRKMGVVSTNNVSQLSLVQDYILDLKADLDKRRKQISRDLQKNHNIKNDIFYLDTLSEEVVQMEDKQSESIDKQVKEDVATLISAEHTRRKLKELDKKESSLNYIDKYIKRVERQQRLANQANDVARENDVEEKTGNAQPVQTAIEDLTTEELAAKEQETRENLNAEISTLEQQLQQIPQDTPLGQFAQRLLQGRNLSKNDEQYAQYIEATAKTYQKQYQQQLESENSTEEEKQTLQNLLDTAKHLGDSIRSIRENIAERNARKQRHDAGFKADSRIYRDADGNTYQFNMQEAEYSQDEGLVLRYRQTNDPDYVKDTDEYVKTRSSLTKKKNELNKKIKEAVSNGAAPETIVSLRQDLKNVETTLNSLDVDYNAKHGKLQEMKVAGNEEFLNSLSYTNNQGQTRTFESSLSRKIKQVEASIKSDVDKRKRRRNEASIEGDVVNDNKSEISTLKWMSLMEDNKSDRSEKVVAYSNPATQYGKSVNTVLTNPHFQAKYWHGYILMPYSSGSQLSEWFSNEKNVSGETKIGDKVFKWDRKKAVDQFHRLGKLIKRHKDPEIWNKLSQLANGEIQHIKIGDTSFTKNMYDNMVLAMPLQARLWQKRRGSRPITLFLPDIGSKNKTEQFSKSERENRIELVHNLLASYRVEGRHVEDDETEENHKNFLTNYVRVEDEDVDVVFRSFDQNIRAVTNENDIIFTTSTGETMSREQLDNYYQAQLPDAQTKVLNNSSSLLELLKSLHYDVTLDQLNGAITDNSGKTQTGLQWLIEGVLKYNDGVIGRERFLSHYVSTAIGLAKKTKSAKISGEARARQLRKYFESAIPEHFLSHRDFQQEFNNTPDIRSQVDEALNNKWRNQIRIFVDEQEINFADTSDANRATITQIFTLMEQALTESKTVEEFMRRLKDDYQLSFKARELKVNAEKVIEDYYSNRHFARLTVPSSIFNAITLAKSNPLNGKIDEEHFRVKTEIGQSNLTDIASLGLVKDSFGNYLYSHDKYASRVKRSNEEDEDFELTEQEAEIKTLEDGFNALWESIQAIPGKTSKGKPKVARSKKHLQSQYDLLKENSGMDSETFDETYLRNPIGVGDKKITPELIKSIFEDLKTKQLEAIEQKYQLDEEESTKEDEFEDSDVSPLIIGYAAASTDENGKGPIIYADEKGQKTTKRGAQGTPGALYLILPRILSSSRSSVPVKLNIQKLDEKTATFIAELLIGVSNGSIQRGQLLSEVKGLSLTAKGNITVDQYLHDTIYIGTDAVTTNPSVENFDKLLYFDDDNVAHYGNSVEGKGIVANDVQHLTQWLLQNKNYRVDRNKLMDRNAKMDYDLTLSDSEGNKVMSYTADTPYLSNIIDQGIVKSDLNTSKSSHIFTQPKVYIKYQKRVQYAAPTNDSSKEGTPAQKKEALKKATKVEKESKDGLRYSEDQQASIDRDNLIMSMVNDALSHLSDEEQDRVKIGYSIKNGIRAYDFSMEEIDGVTTMVDIPRDLRNAIAKYLQRSKTGQITIKLFLDGEVVKVNGKEVKVTLTGTPAEVTEKTKSKSSTEKSTMHTVTWEYEDEEGNEKKATFDIDLSLDENGVSNEFFDRLKEVGLDKNSQEIEDWFWGEYDKLIKSSKEEKSEKKLEKEEPKKNESKGKKVEINGPRTVNVKRGKEDQKEQETEVNEDIKTIYYSISIEDLGKIDTYIRDGKKDKALMIYQKYLLKSLQESAKSNTEAFKQMKTVWNKDYQDNVIAQIVSYKAAPFTGAAVDFIDNAVEKEDFDQAFARVEKMLGKGFNFAIDDKSKKVWDPVRKAQIYVFGQCSAAGIRILRDASNQIAKGAFYHEAFHNISLFVLSSKERKQMYEDAIKLYPELADFDTRYVEEYLADRFAEFVEASKNKNVDVYYSSNPLKRVFQKLYDTIVRLVNRLFNANIRPKYTNLNQLFKDMYSGRFAYAKATKDNIEEFNKVYTRFVVYKGFTVNGVEVADNAQHKDEIFRELLARGITQSNILTQERGVLNFNWDAVKERLEIDQTTYETYRDSFMEKGDFDRALRYANLYDAISRILENWKTWKNYLEQQVNNKFKLDNVENDSNLLLDESGMTFVDENITSQSMAKTINNDDTHHASYSRDNFASMDMDVKLLLYSITKSAIQEGNVDTFTRDGFSRYENVKQVYLELGYVAKDCSTVQEFMKAINERANKDAKSGNTMFQQIYTLFNSISKSLLNSTFTNLAMHRNQYVNTEYTVAGEREDGTEIYEVQVRNANQELVSKKMSTQWQNSIRTALSELASIPFTDKDKRIKAVRDFKAPIANALNNKNLISKEGAKKLADALIEVYGIEVDENSLYKWLEKQSKTTGFIKNLKDNLIGQYSNDTLFVENGVDSAINKMFKVNSYFVSISEFVATTAKPTAKTDSTVGAGGNKIFNLSQFNFINRLFTVKIKDKAWLERMQKNPYCQHSRWLKIFLPFADPKALKPNVELETFDATVYDNNYFEGRDYMAISGLEDLINKFSEVLSGRSIIPSLANKKTYYNLKGTSNNTAVVSFTNQSVVVSANILDIFQGYLADEILAIAHARKVRDDFMEKLNKLTGKTWTVEEFSALSARKQEEIFRNPRAKGLLDNLVKTYHFSDGKPEVYKDGSGRVVTRSFRIDLTKGNGYKFRHFSSMMENFHMTDAEYNKLLGPNANKEAEKIASRYSDDIRKAILNNIGESINRFINDKLINGNRVQLTGRGDMFSQAQLSNTSLPENIIKKYPAFSNLPVPKGSNISSKHVLAAIAQYTVNGMMDMIEFEKLCSGDIAFFKDITAVNKRYSALTSTRKLTSEQGSIYNQFMEEDRLYDSETYNVMTLNTTKVSNDNVFKKYVKQSLGISDALIDILPNEKGTAVTAAIDHTKLLDKDGNFTSAAKKGILVQTYIHHRNSGSSYGVNKNGEKVSDTELAKRICDNALERFIGYLNNDPTDAQVWISAKMARQLKQREGHWNELMEACYNVLENYDRLDKLYKEQPDEFEEMCGYLGIPDATILVDKCLAWKSGKLSSAEYKGYVISIANNMDMTSFKYVHYGSADGRVDDLHTPIYDKMSLSPIFKIWAEGTEMEKLYNFIEKNQIDMVKMESAVKSGGVPSFEMYDEYGNFNESSLKNSVIQTQWFDQLGKQLNTDPHHTTSATLLTQFMKVAVMNIKSNKTYTIAKGAIVKGNELLTLYQNILDTLTLRGLRKYQAKYGIETDKSGNTRVNKAKFMKALKQMAETQDLPNETLQAFGTDANGEYYIHPAAFPNISWIQSRLISDMDKTIIKTVTPGQPLFQVSSLGYDNILDVKQIASDKLKMDNDNNRMEIKLSINFFADVIEAAGLKHATFDVQRKFILENKENFALAYRVPTQGQNSTLAVDIVDVFEPQRGAIIMFPSAITALTGSDFDIDKMFLARPNYEIKNGKMSKIPYNFDKIMKGIDDSVTDEQLQNLLLDIFQTVLTSPEHMLDKATPLDVTTEPLKRIKDEIEEIVGGDVEKNKRDLFYANPIFQTDQKIKNSGSDSGIGPMALNNVFRFFIQMANLKLRKNEYLESLGLSTLNRIYDRNGENILDSTSALINAHVDAVKDNYIGRMNVNSYTFDVTSFLITTGMGNDTYWFLGQQILKDVANNFMNYKNGILGVPEQLRTGDTYIENVIRDYTIRAGEVVTSRATPKEMTEAYMRAALKRQHLNGTPMTDSEWAQQQLRYLNSFKYIKTLAQNYRDALTNAQIDTYKYGITANEILSFIQKHDDFVSEYNIAFENPEEMFTKTFLGEKYDNGVAQMFKVFKDTIFEFTPANANTLTYLSKQHGVYGRYSNNFLKRVGTKLKTALLMPFFNAYLQNHEIYGTSELPLRELVMGEHGVLKRFEAIKRAALLKGIGQEFFNQMQVKKSIDGTPQFVNISTTLKEDNDLKSNFQSSWLELFEDTNDENEKSEIAKWAEDFAVYMFYVTGGTDSNVRGKIKTSVFDLIPPTKLSQLQVGDTTYSDYVAQQMEGAVSQDDVIYDQSTTDLAMMLSAKFDDDIIPVVKPGKSTKITNIDEDGNVITIAKGAHKLLNYNTGLYKPFIKVKRRGGQHTVYRLGSISMKPGKDGRVFVNPVYFKEVELGYRNATYASYSIRADGYVEDGKIKSLLNPQSSFSARNVSQLPKELSSKIVASIDVGESVDFSSFAKDGVMSEGFRYTGFGIPFTTYAAIDAADTVIFTYTGPMDRDVTQLVDYAKFKNKNFIVVDPKQKFIQNPIGTVTIIGTMDSAQDIVDVVNKLPKTTQYVASSEIFERKFKDEDGVEQTQTIFASEANKTLGEMIERGEVVGTAINVSSQKIKSKQKDMINGTVQVIKIISGGQTGIDTLGLEVGRELGITTGGTMSPGFVREKGHDDGYTRKQLEEFGLIEITKELQGGKKGNEFYLPRTEQNVVNSDGTVYFYRPGDTSGLGATKRYATKHNKPFIANPTTEELRNWLIENNIKTLNVAGNRGSKVSEDMRNKVSQVLKDALTSKSTEQQRTDYQEKKHDKKCNR